jgi:hypothetical protein
MLLVLLAGCAADYPEPSRVQEMHYAAARPETQPVREETLPPVQTATTGALPARDAKARPRETAAQLLRDERLAYAKGLEKILLSNGVNVSVVVYEGRADPTPTLMFVGHFSSEFVQRAVTNGAVLQRAKDLGFKSVDFFDRGPDGHYQFVLSKSAPLPKCATYHRLCL